MHYIYKLVVMHKSTAVVTTATFAQWLQHGADTMCIQMGYVVRTRNYGTCCKPQSMPAHTISISATVMLAYTAFCALATCA